MVEKNASLIIHIMKLEKFYSKLLGGYIIVVRERLPSMIKYLPHMSVSVEKILYKDRIFNV